MTNRLPYILLIGLLIVVALAVTPIKIPCNYHAIGRIMAARTWSLTRGNDGQLAATLRNNYTGSAEAYRVLQASVEGQIGLTLDDRLLAQGRVGFGDTIGYIQSSEAEEELVRLKSELSLARAELKASAAGQRPETIEVAECQERYALAAVADKRRVVDRLEALKDRGMVSDEEFEIARGELTLLELDRDLATAKLVEARSGVKAEALNLIRAQIRGLETQIAALEKRMASFTIISPLSGTISRSAATDTVLVIHDDSDRLALLALEWNAGRRAAQADSVVINWRSEECGGTARLKRVEPQVQILEGHQVAYALAEVMSSADVPPPGTVIDCDVQCGRMSLLEIAKRILTQAGVL